MEDLTALKKTRQSLKGNITRLHNWAVSHHNTEKDPAQLSFRITNLNCYFEQYNATQDLIEDLAHGLTASASNKDDDAEQRVALESKYYGTLSLLKNAHAHLTAPSATNQAMAGSNPQLVNVKLPDINI